MVLFGVGAACVAPVNVWHRIGLLISVGGGRPGPGRLGVVGIGVLWLRYCSDCLQAYAELSSLGWKRF